MGIRILIIEDEAPIADFVVRGLREEGFTVEHAADGDAASHALQTGGWDVVLLDWWLPGPDGFTLLRRLRAAGRSDPVLFLATVVGRVLPLTPDATTLPGAVGLIQTPDTKPGICFQ